MSAELHRMLELTEKNPGQVYVCGIPKILDSFISPESELFHLEVHFPHHLFVNET
jgi:hypothetical protein